MNPFKRTRTVDDVISTFTLAIGELNSLSTAFLQRSFDITTQIEDLTDQQSAYDVEAQRALRIATRLTEVIGE